MTGTPFSRHGAEMAIALAQASRGTVTALHVAAAHRTPSSWRQVGAAIAPVGSSDAIIREIVRLGETYGVSVRGAVQAGGDASSEILRQVRAGGHNLLVMGVSLRPGVDLFFGDVPSELLAHSDCSVLFISEPSNAVGESRESKANVSAAIDDTTERRIPITLNTSPNLVSGPSHGSKLTRASPSSTSGRLKL